MSLYLYGGTRRGQCPAVIRDKITVVIADTSYSDMKADKSDNIANNRGSAYASVQLTATAICVEGALADGTAHGFTINTEPVQVGGYNTVSDVRRHFRSAHVMCLLLKRDARKILDQTPVYFDQHTWPDSCVPTAGKRAGYPYWSPAAQPKVCQNGDVSIWNVRDCSYHVLLEEALSGLTGGLRDCIRVSSNTTSAHCLHPCQQQHHQCSLFIIVWRTMNRFVAASNEWKEGGESHIHPDQLVFDARYVYMLVSLF